MNDFAIYNITGLTESVITAAYQAATKVIEPDAIKEIWLLPDTNRVFVYVAGLPCVEVPHDFGTGAETCQST